MNLLLKIGALSLAVAGLSCPAKAQQIGFAPCGGGSVTIAVTTSSNTVQLPSCGPLAIIANVGATEAFFADGFTATTSGYSIAPNEYLVLKNMAGHWVSAITASGSTTLRITQGN